MEGTFLFREGTVSYTHKGKGRAVILLHGFMETKEIWKYYSEMLSSYCRVICIDLPGHGKTDCFGYIHPMELMAECVRAAMRHFRIRRAIVIGHSMGGYAALAFAEKYPDNVAGLCLFHSTASADSAQKKKEREQVIKLVKKNPDSFINQVIPNLFFRQYRSYRREISRMKTMARSNPVQGIVANIEGMKTRKDRALVLRFAPYPVLYIIGQEDNILPYKELLAQSKLAACGYAQLFEDVGHMGFIEAPDKCWISLLRFIKSPHHFKPIV